MWSQNMGVSFLWLHFPCQNNNHRGENGWVSMCVPLKASREMLNSFHILTICFHLTLWHHVHAVRRWQFGVGCKTDMAKIILTSSSTLLYNSAPNFILNLICSCLPLITWLNYIVEGVGSEMTSAVAHDSCLSYLSFLQVISRNVIIRRHS